MKKALPWLLATAFLAGLFFLLQSAFPKYTGFLPFFLLLVLLDAYLWSSVNGKKFRRFIAVLYWLPLMLLLSSVVTGFFISFTQWNVAWRTYLLGFIFVTYVSKFVAILFLMVADLVRIFHLVRRRISNREPEEGIRSISRPRNLFVSGWITGFAVFLLFTSGMIFWNYDFRVRQETIALPELPSSFDGLRIVQISDIHLGSWACKSKLREAVKIINGLKPDLVFFTGDLVNYTSYEAYEYADILKEIRATTGIYAIMGNHDYGDYVSWESVRAKIGNREYLEKIYEYLGWRLLLNENAIIKKGSDSIAVLGVENWGGTRRFPRLGDIDKASAGTADLAVKILLTHDPSHWEKLVTRKYKDIDVTFSGHTHGFQLGIERFGIRWSPSQYMYKNWAGLYESPVPGSHPQYIYVNRGLGSVGYPGRIGILPEITLVELRKEIVK